MLGLLCRRQRLERARVKQQPPPPPIAFAEQQDPHLILVEGELTEMMNQHVNKGPMTINSTDLRRQSARQKK